MTKNSISTARFPFTPYPDGWFAIAFSTDLERGSVLSKHYFGEDMVLYRDDEGKAHCVEPYCPHLGAHLGVGGRVVDNRLRCPFHGWCFDGEGQCVEVPGGAKIPPRAQVKKRPLRELNGMLFVHYHKEGLEPTWEPHPVATENWTDDSKTILWNIKSHPQEIFENSVDSAHLAALHDVPKSWVVREPIADQERFNVQIGMVAPGSIIGMPGMDNDVVLDVTMYGLGFMLVDTYVTNVGIKARERIYVAPIDGERVEIRAVVNVEKFGDAENTEMVAGLFYQAFLTDFVKDFPIWESKRYREKPALSSMDGPFVMYRKWCRQFYSDGNTAPVPTEERIEVPN